MNKVLEVQELIEPHSLATHISNLYVDWNNQRSSWRSEKEELRNYLFATDTSTTSNSELPWKNTTTLPKLTQIRDNLHANYMAALFPNDDWLRWEAYTEKDASKDKSKTIQAYMSNKLREGNFRSVISQCVLDYIDYGNAFGEAVWVNESKTDEETGEVIPGYVGPKLVRSSPLDQVFDPTAISYEKSPKITRYIKTLGELQVDAMDYPSLGYSIEDIEEVVQVRKRIGIYKPEDFDKDIGYSIDGFGSLHAYYNSGYIEILEFEGDIHDFETGQLLRDQIITIVDRTTVIRKEQNPSWLAKSKRAHAGWRKRPDNLYAMGPLDNLVGLQYRLDHLENLKADALDLTIHPPLKIVGDVDTFDWGPGEEIDVGDSGDVAPMPPNPAAFQVNNEIAYIIQIMEEMAGAPKEAMGIRSPGEKTAFEVQTLQNAAGRIFQAKVQQFEIEFIEPILNIMLEMARRNLDGKDLVRVMDDDLGVQEFLEITKEDITATGKVRPIGARHFAARAQLVQNLQGVFNGAIGQTIMPHVSSKALAKLVEDAMGWDRFDLVKDNIQIMEQLESQRLINAGQEQVEAEAMTPVEQEIPLE